MNARLAGLDVGDKRIGVAVSDGLGLTAQALGVVARKSRKRDVEALMELLSPYEIEAFVAGLPLLWDGSEGEQADKVRHFCKHLSHDSGLSVHFQDERMSSLESERLLISAGMRREKRKGKRDQIAAALILQAFLDGRHTRSTTGENNR